MPELSDVEGFRRVLIRHAVRRRIVDVEVRDRTVVHNVSPSRLRQVLTGCTFRRLHGALLSALPTLRS